MNTTSSPPVAVGEVIDGKYRVDRVLGAGGMGIVVAATHVHLDQHVALKFLLPAALAHTEVVARFLREARSAVKIQSEHVAKVLDVGTLSTGAPYMVMEYLDGEDVEQLLTRVGCLPVQDAVDYIMQACEAVAEAHSHGIVHRDLKPANLFLATRPNGRPVVKVLDFGISKTLNAAEASLTKTSAIMGSPLYMSPEQMESARHADVRSDIWALGVVLYEALTLRLPFKADSMPELVVAVLNRKPEPLRELRPEVPEGLDAAVLRCLEKEPAKRFQDIAELATALAPYGRGGSSELVERISNSLVRGGRVDSKSVLPEAAASAPTLAVASHTVASWTQSGTPTAAGARTRKGGRAMLFVGLGAVVVLAGAIALTRAGTAQVPRAAASASPLVPIGDRGAAVAATTAPESHAEPPATGEAERADPPAPPVAATTHPTHAPPKATKTNAAPPKATTAPPIEPTPPPRSPAKAPKSNPLDLKLQN